MHADLVSWNQSSLTKSRVRVRPSRESGNPEVFEFPGFRVALAIPVVSPVERASLPGMTIELFNELQKHRSRDASISPLLHNQLGAPVFSFGLLGIVRSDRLLLPPAVRPGDARFRDSAFNHHLLHGDGSVQRELLVGGRIASVVRMAFQANRHVGVRLHYCHEPIDGGTRLRSELSGAG